MLGAWIPFTEYNYRNSRVCLATKASQCEYGCIGKGPLDRPKPGSVLGGNVLKVGASLDMSTKELRNWVRVNCPWYLVRELPKVRTIMDMWNIKRKVLDHIVDILGPPLSFEEYQSAFHNDLGDRRSNIIRGFMGGLSTADLYSVSRGLPVSIAQAVWVQFLKTLDPCIILNWVGNSGRKRHRSSAFDILSSKRKGFVGN